jgi:hypothetical protein
MRAGLASVLILGAFGAGCLLTTPLDGFADPQAAIGGPDAAPSPGDSGQGADGGADGADAGDAAPDAPSPDFRCSSLATAPLFCTDFDKGTLQDIVASTNTALGGTVTLDETVYRSTSRSLELTSPALTSGVPVALVSGTFAAAPLTSMLVEFDIRIDSIDKGSINTLSIYMGGYVLSVFLGQFAPKLREGLPVDGGHVYTSTDLTAPKAGVWVHFALDIKLAVGASTATLSYDGVAQGPFPLVMESYLAGNWRVDLGLNYITTPDEGREVHVDNLVIDAK